MKTQVQLIFKYIGMGIIAMLLAMCEAGGNTGDTGGDATTDISTYTLSYKTTQKGTAATLSPTWNKDISNATYTISHSAEGTVIAPTIDTSTGEVTIATGTSAGSYTITATGSRSYSGTATATLTITVAPADKTALTTEINAGITAWGNTADFNYIITTAITDMSNLFKDNTPDDNTGYQLFNGDISKWNTSAVENMSGMFNGASTFNQDISDWNTSAVKNMSSMFNGATKFNQDIKTEIDPAGDGNDADKTGDDRWNTNAVENMSGMFNGATAFNRKEALETWDVGEVTNTDGNTANIFVSSGMASNLPCWYDGTTVNYFVCLTLSYDLSPQDTAATVSPTWKKKSNGDTVTITAIYTISYSAVGSIVAPTIEDASTGTVTITTGTTAGVYTITATGTGNYTGTTTAPLTITDPPVDISTYAFSYGTTPKGTAATLSPTWQDSDGNPVDSITATYTIGGWVDRTETNKATINASTGIVTIATSTTAGSYTITATGSGGDSGTATAKVYVTVAPAPDPSADPTSTDPAVLARATGKAALITAINAGTNVWGNKGDFNYIITTAVTDMSSLFATYVAFNGDISQWDTSAVTNMTYMFVLAATFNQPIGNWNTSAVTNMQGMFSSAEQFNQPILTVIDPAKDGNEAGKTSDDRWNTSKVQNMRSMFYNAKSFKQDIDNWNVGAVEDSQDTSAVMFLHSGMTRDPCWYNSWSGYGAIRDPRPPGCAVAD